MKQFQELLDPKTDMTPGAQQALASRRLPDVVESSHLRWWVKPCVIPSVGNLLLVMVAPHSQYDLAMLDILDEVVANLWQSKGSRLEGVYVANLQLYRSVEDLTLDIPDITRIPLQTPLVAAWENGKVLGWACGKSGRDLAARMLGIPAEDFNSQVIARVPKPNLFGGN